MRWCRRSSSEGGWVEVCVGVGVVLGGGEVGEVIAEK